MNQLPKNLTAVQIKGALIADAMDYGQAVADELQQSKQMWLDAIKEKMAWLEEYAYAEGRKDERESWVPEWQSVRGCGWHHYTPDNIAAIIRDLKAVEEGSETPEWINRDHRTRCGILWRVISALAHDVPTNADWRPIETAPIDEQILIAATPDWVSEGIVFVDTDSDDQGREVRTYNWADGSTLHENLKPIAWMPLPKHPDA